MAEVYIVPTFKDLVEKSIKEGPKNGSEIKLRSSGRIDAAALAVNFQRGINERFAEEQDKKKEGKINTHNIPKNWILSKIQAFFALFWKK